MTDSYAMRLRLLLTLALTTIGCAAQVEDVEVGAEDEVGATAQAIWGGTGNEDRGRPAIGQLLENGGFSCTATLVASRVIVTAAHCFHFDTTRSGFGGGVNEPPTFSTANSIFAFRMIPAAPAGAQTVAVRRFTVASTAYGAADIAVAELESDVSWSFANYIGIAQGEPANNAAVTQWGYGCTSAMTVGDPAIPPSGGYKWVNAVGGGVKRNRGATWNAANNTTNEDVGCAGDSGGPILDGAGNLVGVHSAGGGPTNPGLDATGDVISFRRWVTSAAAIYGKRYVCDSCPEVALRTWNGINYVKALNAGDGDVVADATAIGSWERLRIVSFREGFSPWVALQTTSGRWVTAVNGGDGTVISGTNYVNTDETFLLGSRAGGITFGTRKTPRRWVVAEGAGGGVVNANRAAAGDWETFFPVSL